MSTPNYGNSSQSGDSGAKEKAAEVVSTAANETQQVAQNAAGSAKEVAGTAVGGAQQVAGEARQQAGALAQEATTHLRSLVDDAGSQLREHASTQAERAAQGLQQISKEMQALVSGRTDETGKTGEFVQQVGDKLEQAAGRLQAGGINGLMDDLRDMGRRRPGAFLAGAGAVGFGIGRLIRGAQAASNNTSTGSSGAVGPVGSTRSDSIQSTAPNAASVEPGIEDEIVLVEPLMVDDPARTSPRGTI